MILKVPSNTNHSMILWNIIFNLTRVFCDLSAVSFLLVFKEKKNHVKLLTEAKTITKQYYKSVMSQVFADHWSQYLMDLNMCNYSFRIFQCSTYYVKPWLLMFWFSVCKYRHFFLLLKLKCIGSALMLWFYTLWPLSAFFLAWTLWEVELPRYTCT